MGLNRCYPISFISFNTGWPAIFQNLWQGFRKVWQGYFSIWQGFSRASFAYYHTLIDIFGTYFEPKNIIFLTHKYSRVPNYKEG